MIGRIAGRLAHKDLDHVMIDVGGVGYVVHVSERTAAALPPVGQGAALFTDLLVREDLLQLFGFLSVQEREWHRLLTSVQGVGAKASMAVLGTLGAEGVGRAIAIGDVTAIKAAPGIGPKIASRLINELKDKAPRIMAMGSAPEAPVFEAPPPQAADDAPVPVPPPPASTRGSDQAEALSALANLGYGPSDAARAVAEAAGEGAVDTGALIKAALKRLAPK